MLPPFWLGPPSFSSSLNKICFNMVQSAKASWWLKQVTPSCWHKLLIPHFLILKDLNVREVFTKCFESSRSNHVGNGMSWTLQLVLRKCEYTHSQPWKRQPQILWIHTIAIVGEGQNSFIRKRVQPAVCMILQKGKKSQCHFWTESKLWADIKST